MTSSLSTSPNGPEWLALAPHPASPEHGGAAGPLRLAARAELSSAGRLYLAWRIEGDTGRLALPAQGGAHVGQRKDELWRATCFEAFVKRPGDPRYREFNIAPTGDWAVYRFADYREGMENEDAMEVLRIEQHKGPQSFALEAEIAAAPLLEGADEMRLGFSAVLEGADDATSYWALSHPPGDPDFHHSGNFAHELIRERP